MENSSADIHVLQRARLGDREAIGLLMQRYRSRLKLLVAVRIDRRLTQRLDDSDVVQELFLRMSQQTESTAFEPLRCLDESSDSSRCADPDGSWNTPSTTIQPLETSPYVWLRRLALWTLSDLQRKHLGVQQRDPRRELPLNLGNSASNFGLAQLLLNSESGPLDAMVREERSRELDRLLKQMEPIDREILSLRHGEQLSRSETAEVLQISVAAVAKRYLRALRRIREKMKDWEE